MGHPTITERILIWLATLIFSRHRSGGFLKTRYPQIIQINSTILLVVLKPLILGTPNLISTPPNYIYITLQLGESEQSHDDWQENSATPINVISQELNWHANMNALIVNMALLQVAMYETNKQNTLAQKPCWTQLQVTEHWMKIDGNWRVYQFTINRWIFGPCFSWGRCKPILHLRTGLGELLQVAKITLNGSGKLVI